MRELIIAPELQDQDLGRPRKSRSFRAVKLAHVCAGMLWEGGQLADAPIRPVWMTLAGTDMELRPFVANLRLGKRAELVDPSKRFSSRDKPTRFELLRSVEYTYTTQRLNPAERSPIHVVTAAMDEVLVLDPGLIDPVQCQFLVLPPAWWVEQERRALDARPNEAGAILRHMQKLGVLHLGGALGPKVALMEDELLDAVPIAALCLAYLDRRTRRPLFTSPAFALQLYLAALASGVFSFSAPSSYSFHHEAIQTADDRWRWGRWPWAALFREEDTDAAGLLPGIVCQAMQAKVDELLIREVQRYVRLTQ